MSVRPGAEAFAHDGDDAGVLLCHGFTGNPSSLRPWAEHLAAAGHTVRLPRLPGHGTTWQEMNRTGWADWYGEVDGLVLVNPAVKLEDKRLAAVPVVRFVLSSLPPVGNDVKKPGVTEDAYDKVPSHALHAMLGAYRTVSADLGRVTQPIRLFRSAEDHVVPASSSAYIREHVSSADLTETVLTDSYHVATIDNDAQMIFERTTEFVADLHAAVGGAR